MTNLNSKTMNLDDIFHINDSNLANKNYTALNNLRNNRIDTIFKDKNESNDKISEIKNIIDNKKKQKQKFKLDNIRTIELNQNQKVFFNRVSNEA
jgi:hypothetical protein